MKPFLLIFSLIVFIAIPYYSQSQETSSSTDGDVLYCKSFNSLNLINYRKSYNGCSKDHLLKDQAHFRIYRKNHIVQKVERYSANGQLVNIETFTYRYNRVGRKHSIGVYSNGNSRYLTYRYFRVAQYGGRLRKAGGDGTNHFIEYGIKAQLNMHNGKKYRLFYVKKIEKYRNSLLSNVSYYDQTPNKRTDRLRIRIFYYQQRISGYKIRRYNKTYTEEEYYEGKRRWINLYNPLGQPELGFYFSPKSSGFFFSVYYYDKYHKNNQLLIKENYYTRNSRVYQRKGRRLVFKGNVHKLLLTQVMQKGHESMLKTIVKKMFQARGLLKRKRTLEKRRKLWEKTFLAYGGRRKVERKSIWYFQKKETEQKVLVNSHGTFNESINKIEYYISDVLRRVEYYNPKGQMETVNHYDYK
ncbi:MAG TPA: hypothetical protein ENI73_01770, partial [Spirochaetes bacterium]|nr:hypothetical protein [Spirochaetota bacterium]